MCPALTGTWKGRRLAVSESQARSCNRLADRQTSIRGSKDGLWPLHVHQIWEQIAMSRHSGTSTELNPTMACLTVHVATDALDHCRRNAFSDGADENQTSHSINCTQYALISLDFNWARKPHSMLMDCCFTQGNAEKIQENLNNRILQLRYAHNKSSQSSQCQISVVPPQHNAYTCCANQLHLGYHIAHHILEQLLLAPITRFLAHIRAPTKSRSLRLLLRAAFSSDRRRRGGSTLLWCRVSEADARASLVALLRLLGCLRACAARVQKVSQTVSRSTFIFRGRVVISTFQCSKTTLPLRCCLALVKV